MNDAFLSGASGCSLEKPSVVSLPPIPDVVLGGAIALVSSGVTLYFTNRHQRRMEEGRRHHEINTRIFDYEYDRVRRVEAAMLEITIWCHDPRPLSKRDEDDEDRLAEAMEHVRESLGFLARYQNLVTPVLAFMVTAAKVEPKPRERRNSKSALEARAKAGEEMRTCYQLFRAEFDRLVQEGFLTQPQTALAFTFPEPEDAAGKGKAEA